MMTSNHYHTHPTKPTSQKKLTHARNPQKHRGYNPNLLVSLPRTPVPPSHTLVKQEDDPVWYGGANENSQRPEHHNSPGHGFVNHVVYSTSQQHFMSNTHFKVENTTTDNILIPSQLLKQKKPKAEYRTPHLPAQKNAAQRAARMAAECPDKGPDTLDRFKCSVNGCKKAFLRRYNLKVHSRRHTNETPYSCLEPGCGKKFKWRSSMAHHHKSHQKQKADAKRMITVTGITTPRSMPQNVGGTSEVGHAPSEPLGFPRAHHRVKMDASQMLPTSPISSESVGHSLGLDNMHQGGATGESRFSFPQAHSVDVGMDEFGFNGVHVPGDTIFDKLMQNTFMDGHNSQG